MEACLFASSYDCPLEGIARALVSPLARRMPRRIAHAHTLSSHTSNHNVHGIGVLMVLSHGAVLACLHVCVVCAWMA